MDFTHLRRAPAVPFLDINPAKSTWKTRMSAAAAAKGTTAQDLFDQLFHDSQIIKDVTNPHTARGRRYTLMSWADFVVNVVELDKSLLFHEGTVNDYSAMFLTARVRLPALALLCLVNG